MISAKYTAPEINRALAAVVYHDGNYARAARALKADGIDIHKSTLREWVIKAPERYAEVRDKILPEVHAKVAEEHTAMVRESLEVERIYLNRMREEAENVPVRDLSTFQRNAATATGIHTDKAMALRGMHEARGATININLAETVRGLSSRFGAKFFDSEGKEIDPKTIIEGEAKEVPADG